MNRATGAEQRDAVWVLSECGGVSADCHICLEPWASSWGVPLLFVIPELRIRVCCEHSRFFSLLCGSLEPAALGGFSTLSERGSVVWPRLPLSVAG